MRVKLSISRLTILTEDLNKTKTNLDQSLLIDLHLQDDSIQDLDARALESTRVSSKTGFESFVEAEHLLRS